MIFITGDVHDTGLRSPDQHRLKKKSAMTEMDCALKYAKLAERYNIPVTLFVTGQIAQKERDNLKGLAGMQNVEIGGHTWNGLQPSWLHFLRERLMGSYYGSKCQQEKDIIAL